MRRTLLVMATMSFAVLVIGGVAYAANIRCDTDTDPDTDPGECRGTVDSDNIRGTSRADFIDALEGNDTVNAGGNPRGTFDNVLGREGDDTLHGRGGQDALVGGGGFDTLFGEGRDDVLTGGALSNVYFGGNGTDRILADTISTNGGSGGEEIHGGRGDDIIFADDGLSDNISCGPGNDTVDADEGTIDTLAPLECETIG